MSDEIKEKGYQETNYFDSVLDHIGHFGRFQIYVYLLACVPQLFVGIHMLASVFIAYVPEHRCFIDGCDNATSQFNESWVSYSIPHENTEIGSVLSECHYFTRKSGSNYTCSNTTFSKHEAECDKWVWSTEEFQSTVVSDFGMVCKKKSNGPLSDSLFMLGILTGSVIFGHTSDRWGRKSVFLVAPALLSASSIGTAFANSFPLFTFLRFITAASVSGLFQTGYILAIEFVGKSKRLWCANSLQMIFAGGELLLVGAASITKKWKSLQLIISVPTVLLLGYNWLLPESVRWQLSRKQFEKAKATVLKAASWNKVTIPENLLQAARGRIDTEVRNVQSSNPLDLVRTPKLRKWTLNLFFNWIVNALVYYGLSLSAANLSGNLYLNFAALALVEIPAVFLATVALKRVGRRPVLCSVMIFGGIACISTVFVPKELGKLSTALAILGKSAIAASFATIYIYSAEIYPTVLRNTGIGFSSMCARVGSIVAPFIAAMHKLHTSVPMIIFGGSSIVAGALAFLLPETHNQELPETVEDAEAIGGRRPTHPGSSEETMRLLAEPESPDV